MLRAARRNWLVWFVVLPVALWALVRVLGLDSGFPVVALMAFTPYVAVAAVALVAELDPDLLSVQELTPPFAAKLERHGIGERLPNAVLSVAPGTGVYANRFDVVEYVVADLPNTDHRPVFALLALP